MNTGGWIIMLVSVTSVALFFAWCIHKVLTAPQPEEMHGFEFETPDEKAQREEDHWHP